MNEELILAELKEMKEDIRAIKAAMYESGDNPGLLSRLRITENRVAAIYRVIWLTIAGVITIATTVIATVVFHVKIG